MIFNSSLAVLLIVLLTINHFYMLNYFIRVFLTVLKYYAFDVPIFNIYFIFSIFLYFYSNLKLINFKISSIKIKKKKANEVTNKV